MSQPEERTLILFKNSPAKGRPALRETHYVIGHIKAKYEKDEGSEITPPLTKEIGGPIKHFPHEAIEHYLQNLKGKDCYSDAYHAMLHEISWVYVLKGKNAISIGKEIQEMTYEKYNIEEAIPGSTVYLHVSDSIEIAEKEIAMLQEQLNNVAN